MYVIFGGGRILIHYLRQMPASSASHLPFCTLGHRKVIQARIIYYDPLTLDLHLMMPRNRERDFIMAVVEASTVSRSLEAGAARAVVLYGVQSSWRGTVPQSGAQWLWQLGGLIWSAFLIKKQRHYFANKGLVKAMVFPVVMYGCETWTIKKAEYQRIDAFELCAGEDSWESLGLQRDPTSPS